MAAFSIDVWRHVGRQLGQPEGRTGRLIAWLMDKANAVPVRAAIDALDMPANANVLEIGVGTGRGIKNILSRHLDCRAAGIDRSGDMVGAAKRRNERAIVAGRADIRQACANNLPWAEASFDRVLAINVAYFFAPGGAEMREAYRVLRPRGRAVFYVTARASMEGWRFASAATHRTYDAGDLLASMANAGFSHLEIKHLALPFGLQGLIGVGTKPAD